jgi:hypothetical protein
MAASPWRGRSGPDGAGGRIADDQLVALARALGGQARRQGPALEMGCPEHLQLRVGPLGVHPHHPDRRA